MHNDTLTIRLAEPDDLDDIVAMEHEIFTSPWSREALELELVPNTGRLPALALRDGSPVGYALAWVVADEVHLVSLAVRPAHQRQGIGDALLRWLLDSVPVRLSQIMTLEVRSGNAAAIGLYEAHGFKPVAMRPRYYPDNHEDALVMIKYLREFEAGTS